MIMELPKAENFSTGGPDDLQDQFYEVERSFHDLEANGESVGDKPAKILKEFEWYLQMRTLSESKDPVDQQAFYVEKKKNLARFNKFDQLYGTVGDSRFNKVSLEELEAFVEKMREISKQYE